MALNTSTASKKYPLFQTDCSRASILKSYQGSHKISVLKFHDFSRFFSVFNGNIKKYY